MYDAVAAKGPGIPCSLRFSAMRERGGLLHSGPLLHNSANPKMARVAIEHRNRYLAMCRKLYGDHYCQNLLGRAAQVSLHETQ